MVELEDCGIFGLLVGHRCSTRRGRYGTHGWKVDDWGAFGVLWVDPVRICSIGRYGSICVMGGY